MRENTEVTEIVELEEIQVLPFSRMLGTSVSLQRHRGK